jgi:uncharacterized protein (DUF362 family)
VLVGGAKSSKRPVRPVCSVAKSSDARQAVFEALNRIELPDLRGQRVLLKPNVGRTVEQHRGINTNPEVTEAVFDYLRARFDADYFIGDSPVTGVKSREAFVKSGHGAFLERDNIRYIDLDSRKPVVLSVPGGRVLTEVKLTGFIPEIDYLVSIPVLKMHMHTGASLGYKNLKGLLYRREKIRFHQLHVPEAKEAYGFKELDLAIADLAKVVEPDLVVCDATYAMEGMGPSAGDTKRLDTVIASTDALAADLVALAVVKLDIGHVAHLRLIAEETGRVRSVEEIDTIPGDLTPFKTDFALPPTEIVIQNMLVDLIDEGSCSACQSSVYLFLRNNEALISEYFGKHGHFAIAMGTDVREVPPGTFLVGNCTAHLKDRGTFLVGCPPDQTSMAERVRENMTERE